MDFIEYVEQEIATMRTAWLESDLDRLAEAAHSLKGAGGSAGFAACLLNRANNCKR